MARIRTIKPDFFKNEELAELPMPVRLTFIGLWTLADVAGRLEDRPKRIKAELFPYDDVDMEAHLAKLAAHGFIRRYEVAGVKAIAVPNFKKHQRITGKEAATTSSIPAPPEGDPVEDPERADEAPENQEGSNGETPGKHPGSQEGKGKDHDPPLPPQGEKAGEVSDVDLLPDPPRLRRPDQAWRALLSSVDFFPGEVDFLAEEFLGVNVPDGLAAVHPFKRPKLEAWLGHPRVARELAHQWAGTQSWARNVFGAAMAYLENPGRFKEKEPEVGQPPARPERDLSGWRSLLKGQGSATDDDWLSFQAERAKRGGFDVDPEAVRAKCKAEGLAVAGPWLFALLTSDRKATS